jgi:hypothetical protein
LKSWAFSVEEFSEIFARASELVFYGFAHIVRVLLMVPNGLCRRLLSDSVVDTRVLQVFLNRFLHLIGIKYAICVDGVATGATATGVAAGAIAAFTLDGITTGTAGLILVLVHSAYGVSE